ncbi:MAG: hypothetical protein JW900_09200 [Anaerolineae bacterium]|nr:hypothetical protein [Anaerolineae bacterium]
MFKERIETSAAPTIAITECLGDLVIRGTEESWVDIRLRGRGNDVTLERDGDRLEIAARADCYLTCPHGATLSIGTVRGGFKLKDVTGAAEIATVNGDVVLRGTGPIALQEAFGDLSARQVAGGLDARTVAGDARVQGVAESLAIGRAGGNLRADGIAGGLEVEAVGSDAALGPPFSPGAAYRLTVGSNLRVYVPADASLRLAFQVGGRVRSDLPDHVFQESAGETTAVIGAGEASLEATVGGHVRLQAVEGSRGEDFEADLDGLGLTIEARIAEAMADMESRLAQSMRHLDDENLRRRIERVAEQARQQAGHTADRARLQAERAAQRAQMRAEQAERRWRRASGQRPRPERPAVSDEERLRVLRMVEEGKVSPEQAADLLAALEGK